ncbi:MAG: PKD domain-containing protein, partial [Acidimicrobiales bacterium]
MAALSAPPTAKLSVDPTSGSAPLTVTFDGSPSSTTTGDPLARWTLEFGDGDSTSGTGPPPSSVVHTYKVAGRYIATLDVFQADGQSASTTADISATDGPAANLTATPGFGTVPLTVAFDGSASTPGVGGALGSWTLDFGDGTSTSGTGTPPSSETHTYDNPGTYVATLTVIDGGGAKASASATVVVNPPSPTAVLTVSQASGPSPLTVTFDGSASTPGTGGSTP